MVRLSSWEDKDTVPVMAGSGLSKTMAPRDRATLEEFPLPRFDFDRKMCIRDRLVAGEEALRVLKIMEAALHSGEINAAVDFE